MAKVVKKKGSAKVAKTQKKVASKGKAKVAPKKTVNMASAKKPVAKSVSAPKNSKPAAAAPVSAKGAAAAKGAAKATPAKGAAPKATAIMKGVPAGKPATGKGVKAPAAAPAPETVVAKGSKGSKLDKKAEALAQLLAAQAKEEAEVVLTNADGKQYCRVHDCDNEATTDGHCRFHYLALWKRNKVKAKILQNGKLDKYIEDLTSKYPDKYLEMLRKDLASEKDFNVIVAEMDVEDSGDEAEQEEDANRFIEEVRGGMPSTDDDDGGF